MIGPQHPGGPPPAPAHQFIHLPPTFALSEIPLRAASLPLPTLTSAAAGSQAGGADHPTQRLPSQLKSTLSQISLAPLRSPFPNFPKPNPSKLTPANPKLGKGKITEPQTPLRTISDRLSRCASPPLDRIRTLTAATPPRPRLPHGRAPKPDARVPAAGPSFAMATDPGGDACPLCGAGEEQAAVTAGPARVTLRKRQLPAEAVARVGPGDEAAALRESVAWHQSGMANLQEELEAERGAAAEAASEAMSMILRLQRDKSEAMMEARQFRRFAEDRFAHDAAEVAALHDAIARRDASIHSLSTQLRACRSRLLHLGFLSPSSLPSSPTAAAARDQPFADDEYPSIQCLDHPAPSDVGTPRTHHLLNRMPGRAADKGVISARPRHGRALSNDSLFAYDAGIAVADEFPFGVEQDVSDWDDECDRVYTVDTVHGVPVATPEDCRYFSTPMGSDVGLVGGVGAWAEEHEIHKLMARLQALEADRESMRHAIMSMGAEKAQVVMLKDIAQHLCEEAAPLNAVSLKMQPALQPVVAPERKVVKRQTFFAKCFVVTVIKWVASAFCRGKQLDRIKYPFGLCGTYVGLMLLLDRSHKQRYGRHLKRS